MNIVSSKLDTILKYEETNHVPKGFSLLIKRILIPDFLISSDDVFTFCIYGKSPIRFYLWMYPVLKMFDNDFRDINIENTPFWISDELSFHYKLSTPNKKSTFVRIYGEVNNIFKD